MLPQFVLSNFPVWVCLIVVMVSTASTVNCWNSRKLDDNMITVPSTASPDGQKCSPACGQNPSPPPPSPPLPSPPPPSPPIPALPPPSPTPPSPKKPPSQYCAPPPPSSYLYMTGPPGQLYPIDADFNGSCTCLATSLTLLIACGLLGLLVFC